MPRILPLGALLALGLVACSGSGDPLGPEDIRPSMDPARGSDQLRNRSPHDSCQPAVAASWMGSGVTAGQSLRVELVCSWKSQSA
jgi:hypothetical protein